ncbi:glycerol-3-phosphate dehydrogenase [Asaia siamensis]
MTTHADSSQTGTIHDLLIIGGGINGAGIARDAAGRGLKVMLVEKDDLASHTSSASTKLIHGGLRYLEYYEFRLVREALNERERLLKIAPHIIWPMRFILPHSAMLRPAWLLRTGLFLYDNLCRTMTLPKTRSLRLHDEAAGRVLRPDYVRGFEYSDGWVQDSRLVVLNAQDAARRGATICTRTRLISAERHQSHWVAILEDTLTGETRQVTARALINAAGPWVAELLQDRLSIESRNHVRLVKGSHIVVPRQFDTEQAYILQNPDKRIVFAIPYEKDFTLIGTTDIPWDQDPGSVTISADEIAYLCESVNRYFKRAITPQDVVWSYAGVRPLYDDHSGNASAVTRDYRLDIDHSAAPVLSVFGGKITTYRKLAEHALEKLAPHLKGLTTISWTADAPLPGGDFQRTDFDRYVASLQRRVAGLSQQTATRLVRNYGTLVETVMLPPETGGASLGALIGADLHEGEVDYLMTHEWARTAEDILWRRSKLGLRFSSEDVTKLQDYMASRLQQNAAGQETDDKEVA